MKTRLTKYLIRRTTNRLTAASQRRSPSASDLEDRVTFGQCGNRSRELELTTKQNSCFMSATHVQCFAFIWPVAASPSAIRSHATFGCLNFADIAETCWSASQYAR